MRLVCPSFLLFAAMTAANLYGQRAVDSRNLYERVWAVLPMIGSGTYQDPKRPLYAPLPAANAAERAAAGRSGVLSFSCQISDDGSRPTPGLGIASGFPRATQL